MKHSLIGILYLFSLVFLTFIISFVMGYIQHDKKEKVVREVIKRWCVLLFGIGGSIVLLMVIEAVVR